MNDRNSLVCVVTLLTIALSGIMRAQAAAARHREPDAKVTLQGRVVDMRGEGVTAAAVTVAHWDHATEVLAQTTTDGEGLFRVRAPQLALGQYWLVSATSEGRSLGSEAVLSPEQPALLRLHDGVTLRGRIVNAAGKPVANTEVCARSTSVSLRGAIVTVLTDAQGDFELHHVAVGPTSICAFVNGEGLVTAHLRATEDASVSLASYPGPKTSIRITIEGLPAGEQPEALLILSGHGNKPLTRLPPSLELIHVAGHEWKCEHLPDWRYVLDVRRAGYAMTPEWNRMARSEGPHQVTLSVKPIASEQTTTSAIVRDANNQPVAGAKMTLVAFGADIRVPARSDANGRVSFRSSLARGSKAILLATDERWIIDREVRAGHSGAQVQECSIEPGKVIDVRVVPACLVEGRILLDSGQPAAFTKVALQERLHAREGVWTPVNHRVTNRDGTFRFTSQVARKGSVRLQIASALGSAMSDPIAMHDPGDQATDLELRLAAPSVVTGTVVAADGQPAIGLVVRARYPDERGANRAYSVEVVTDKQGRYRILGVLPGQARVQLMKTEQLEGAGVFIEVKAGDTPLQDLGAPWIGR